MGYPSLGRRSFLRGAGGAVIALPLLDIMLDDHGEALADGTALPCRYLVSFGGFSLRTDKDGSSDGFIPNAVGPGYDLKPGLAPLASIPGYGSVQEDVSDQRACSTQASANPSRLGADDARRHPSPWGPRREVLAGRLQCRDCGPSRRA